MPENPRTVKKIPKLLEAHTKEVIESLGHQAFDLLTPKQVRDALKINGARIPDLVRQGWLEPAPSDFDAGPAHQYYRWRVEFVKRFKRPYRNSEKEHFPS